MMTRQGRDDMTRVNLAYSPYIRQRTKCESREGPTSTSTLIKNCFSGLGVARLVHVLGPIGLKRLAILAVPSNAARFVAVRMWL